MTVQITIIGLGQMGGSIGLTLAQHAETIRRVGHDRDPEAARTAVKVGAVDALHANLPASVKDADAVILSLPLNEARATLASIRADLKEGAVVLDISPAKRQGETWARELLPSGRYYFGLVPAINPLRLLEAGGGMNGARSDLFQDATCLVCPPPGAPESAVRLATDLVTMLGAIPILSDAAEADGLLATMVTLPKLLAVSLVDATMNKPGWREAQNLAGRSYAMPVASTFDRDEADALRESALSNRDNLVRLLDGYLASLRGLRDKIANGDSAALDASIRTAQANAYGWLAERHLEKYHPAEDADAMPVRRVRRALFGSWFRREPQKK